MGGAKPRADTSSSRTAALPFNYCALTCRPCIVPVCTPQGHLFDESAILEFLKQNGAVAEGLTQNVFQDPVAYHPFSENSKIAAIRTTGNVYLYDTIKRLNLDSRVLKDLLTDEPFMRQDVVILQDPDNPRQTATSATAIARERERAAKEEEKRSSQSHHLTKERDLSHNDVSAKDIHEETKIVADSSIGSKRRSNESGASPQEVDKKRVLRQIVTGGAALAASSAASSAAASLQGGSALSLLSQSSNSVTMSDSELRQAVYQQLKRTATMPATAAQKKDVKKFRAYVRIVTSLGNLNFELMAEYAPETCHNFVKLAQKGFYDGLTFHRLIPKFMIQGGDPVGTGQGGESAWEGGKPFKDEIKLKHSERGMLAMANSGPNTNTSQFYITFVPTPHLDQKHTVFGRLVGGGDVLDQIEKVKTISGTDQPDVQGGLKIVKVVVFSEPFTQITEIVQRLGKDAGKSLPSAASSSSVKAMGLIESLVGTWTNNTQKPSEASDSKPAVHNALAVPIASAAAATTGGSQTVGKYLRLPGTTPSIKKP